MVCKVCKGSEGGPLCKYKGEWVLTTTRPVWHVNWGFDSPSETREITRFWGEANKENRATSTYRYFDRVAEARVFTCYRILQNMKPAETVPMSVEEAQVAEVMNEL